MSTASVAGKLPTANEKKYLKTKEWVFYLLAMFFFSSMTGMVNSYRRAYLVDVLLLSNDQLSFFNGFTQIVGYVLSFIYALILDNKKIKNNQKFKPLGLLAAIPCGVVTALIFWTPDFVQRNPTVLLIWLCALALIQGCATYFGGTVTMVAAVMTPNDKEREQLLSFRGIASAIGNSAPLVIVLVVAAIIKAANGGTENAALSYFISAILCGVVGTITMLLGMSVIKERIVYKSERKNPFKGLWNVIRSKHAWVILISEFLKSFRGIATFMEPFIAAAILGSSSQTVLFALPVGIGTMVGMLIISRLLKRFTSRVLYIASGVYSVCINAVAFGVGYAYLTHMETLPWLNYIFIVCLFGTGIQFGASNLLPEMFKADVLDDLELKTGSRLDASLGFFIGIGGTISGALANIAVPYILYGDGSIIHYQQGLGDGTVQTLDTKIMLLLFYTVFHGLMMLLAGLPFLFYKLSGAERERVHTEVLKMREELAQSEGVEAAE